MTLARDRLCIFIEETQCGTAVSVVALQNGELIGEIVLRKRRDTGNARGKVRRIRLKRAGAKCLFKGFSVFYVIVNRVGLIAVGYNQAVSQNMHRRINDKRRINKL